MALIEIPKRYLTSPPIIISSPTTRCGTTLVQRLLSASDNAFVYGEELGHQLKVLASLFGTQLAHYDQNGEDLNRTFSLALGGLLTEWKPGLSPPTDVMLRAWVDIYYQIPTALAAFGQSMGRPLWGFKWPACDYDTLHAFLALMPKARVVYVRRGLEGALKSAKARRFVQSEADAEAFCKTWAANIGAFNALRQDDRVLFLDYEALIGDPQAQIDRLAAFTGAANIRRDELDLKINTFIGDQANGHAPGGYIAPQALTPTEAAFVRAHTQAVRALLEV